jgi:hypothetical protein
MTFCPIATGQPPCLSAGYWVHQGAVSHDHLDYYLDEYTFRFNRRTSRSRGKLFYCLAQQAVAIEPTPYKTMVKRAKKNNSEHKI